MFPSLNPARREDVVLLQSWLKDTMAQLTAEFGDKGAATVQVPGHRDRHFQWDWQICRPIGVSSEAGCRLSRHGLYIFYSHVGGSSIVCDPVSARLAPRRRLFTPACL